MDGNVMKSTVSVVYRTGSGILIRSKYESQYEQLVHID